MYLFPYDKVRKNSKIILYGAGNIGKEYYSQICAQNYVKLVKWIDKDYKKYESCDIKIENIELNYKEIDFDYIIVAIHNEKIYMDIYSFLKANGIDDKKIVWDIKKLDDICIEKKYTSPTNTGYSEERNVQILIALLKKRGVKKIVVSPGATNMCFVRSVQNDNFFELISVIDERSAAYIACGIAQESNKPVALSCTGATASRNYIPGMTEAYYRKLPILAITSSQYFGRVDNNFPQMIDRRVPLNDIANYHTRIPMINNEEDEWYSILEINKALGALTVNGGGPAHIDLETLYSEKFNVKELPNIGLIDIYEESVAFPDIVANRKIVICIGNHKVFSGEIIGLIEEFCRKYGAVVFADLLSNYNGKYKICPALLSSQVNHVELFNQIDLLIYLGNTTGYSFTAVKPKEVWRISEDGKVVDLFKKTTKVFYVQEKVFFSSYINKDTELRSLNWIDDWEKIDKKIRNKEFELPFSNAWIARECIDRVDSKDLIHLAILNSLRCWNLAYRGQEITAYSNTGAFGIDGCMSTMIGASIESKDKINYLIIGDLSFFYDLNVIGNNNIDSNVRIMLINNGMGAEFRTYRHKCNLFGDDTNKYIAAEGHNGNKSETLVKEIAKSLEFDYLYATNKTEFNSNASVFFERKKRERPMIFEVFTSSSDEGNALEILYNLN